MTAPTTGRSRRIGFQSERRDLWEAPNVYLGMSPFLYANNLTGALLMYHGLGDQNVGTDPDNSIRLFHALNGLGKPVAMYLYPFEDHGPGVARDAARSVGTLGRVARQVRQEPAEGRQEGRTGDCAGRRRELTVTGVHKGRPCIGRRLAAGGSTLSRFGRAEGLDARRRQGTS